MERFNVSIVQTNQKGDVSFQSVGENVGANNLADFAGTLTHYFTRTVNHYEFLSEKGVKGIQKMKPKMTGLTKFNIEWLGDEITFSLEFKDFGKFVKNNEAGDVEDVIYESLKYVDEIGYLFENKTMEAQGNK
jgi:hypothetical protein